MSFWKKIFGAASAEDNTGTLDHLTSYNAQSPKIVIKEGQQMLAELRDAGLQPVGDYYKRQKKKDDFLPEKFVIAFCNRNGNQSLIEIFGANKATYEDVSKRGQTFRGTSNEVYDIAVGNKAFAGPKRGLSVV